MADVFHRGSWKSFYEMEASITVEELYMLQGAVYREEHRRNKFAAALKGVDLDKETGGDEGDPFLKIQMKAQADMAGKTEDEFVFDMLGVEIDTEEEVYD